MDYNLDGKERRIGTMTLNINGSRLTSIKQKTAFTNYSLLKIILSKNSHQIETSQLICFANQLTGLYKNFY